MFYENNEPIRGVKNVQLKKKCLGFHAKRWLQSTFIIYDCSLFDIFHADWFKPVLQQLMPYCILPDRYIIFLLAM